jgi:hypothetical protein
MISGDRKPDHHRKLFLLGILVQGGAALAKPAMGS